MEQLRLPRFNLNLLFSWTQKNTAIKAAKGIKSHTSFKGKHKVSGLTRAVRLAERHYNQSLKRSSDNRFLKLCCDVGGQRSSKKANFLQFGQSHSVIQATATVHQLCQSWYLWNFKTSSSIKGIITSRKFIWAEDQTHLSLILIIPHCREWRHRGQSWGQRAAIGEAEAHAVFVCACVRASVPASVPARTLCSVCRPERNQSRFLIRHVGDRHVV